MTPRSAVPIYLDYAASAPVDPAVAAAMYDVLTSSVATTNPSSAHSAGREATARVEAARDDLATALGAQAREIVWTSGATEADNLAVIGGARMQRARGRGQRVVTLESEHQAVLEACNTLASDGFTITRLAPGRDGLLAPDALAAALDDDVALVSVMAVNNETGVIQDISALGELARQYGALMHVDAAQGFGQAPWQLVDWPVDLISLSAHKWGGPVGVGALWRRLAPRARIQPLIVGGGQEGGLRGGTVALHQVVGMAEAYRLWCQRREADQAHVEALRQRLEEGLASVPGLVRNGRTDGAPHILNVSVAGVHGDALRSGLGSNVTVSAGSACSSRDGEPSHVLRSMGRPDALAGSALRISLGRELAFSELDAAVACITQAVATLRAVSPAWRRLAEGVRVGDLYGMAEEPPMVTGYG